MESSTLSGRSILIAEDEPLIALDIAEAFKDAGATTVVTATLHHALVLVEHGGLSAAVLDGLRQKNCFQGEFIRRGKSSAGDDNNGDFRPARFDCLRKLKSIQAPGISISVTTAVSGAPAEMIWMASSPVPASRIR